MGTPGPGADVAWSRRVFVWILMCIYVQNKNEQPDGKNKKALEKSRRESLPKYLTNKSVFQKSSKTLIRKTSLKIFHLS